MSIKSFFDSGMILAGITAFFYCSSSAKFGGFITPYHLDSDVLGRNFQQVLYDGFLTSYPVIFKAIFALAALSFIRSHMAIPFASEYPKIILSVKKIFKSKSGRIVNDKELKARDTTKKIMIYAIIAALSLTYLTKMEATGKKEAIARLGRINTDTVLASELVNVKIDGHLKQLVFLMCGERNCAGIDQKTKEIFYYPQNGHSYLLDDSIAHKIDGETPEKVAISEDTVANTTSEPEK